MQSTRRHLFKLAGGAALLSGLSACLLYTSDAADEL